MSNNDIIRSLDLLEAYEAGDEPGDDANLNKDGTFEVKKDSDFEDMYSVFGTSSGYKYGSYPTKDEAENKKESLDRYKEAEYAGSEYYESEEMNEENEQVDSDYEVVNHSDNTWKVMNKRTGKCYGYHVVKDVADQHALSLIDGKK